MSAQSWWQAARDRALRSLFDNVEPSTRPSVVSVGAQPGAGKTRAFNQILRTTYPGEQFVSILGDRLRRFHIDYARLAAAPDPETMPAQTAPLSAWLVQEALSYAAQRGYNTAVEGTLRRPEVTLNTLAQFVERGATTHLVVLAVSEFDSWAGCIDRYLGLLEAGANARWTPLSAHDAGFAGTPVTLEAAASSGVVGRLSIVTRDGTALYDSQVTHGCPHDATTACASLQSGRRLPAPEQMVRQVAELSARARALSVSPVVIDGIAHLADLAGLPDSRSQERTRIIYRAALSLSSTAPSARTTSRPSTTSRDHLSDRRGHTL